MTIYKKDLREIVEKGLNLAISNECESWKQYQRHMLTKYIEQNKLQDRIDIFHKNLCALQKQAGELREAIPSWRGPFVWVDDFRYYDTSDAMLEFAIEGLLFENIQEDYDLWLQDHRDKKKAIRDEYEKLNGQLTSLSPAKGYDLLHELGFDVSGIDVAKQKNELVTVALNKSLLGVGVSK
ncbi:TPA_asm: hypothetical protein GI975_11070 [Listeria monocytogenes]|nr:hypothetical protein [Listeria monocytogenes]